MKNGNYSLHVANSGISPHFYLGFFVVGIFSIVVVVVAVVSSPELKWISCIWYIVSLAQCRVLETLKLWCWCSGIISFSGAVYNFYCNQWYISRHFYLGILNSETEINWLCLIWYELAQFRDLRPCYAGVQFLDMILRFLWSIFLSCLFSKLVVPELMGDWFNAEVLNHAIQMLSLCTKCFLLCASWYITH